jgi:hypothetical protein
MTGPPRVQDPDSGRQITKDILSSPKPQATVTKGRRCPVIDNFEDRSIQAQSDRERRIKRRFQIDQEVKYKMLYGQRIAETGTGRTLNISSGGVWFSTESMLTSGMPVELSMNWPVLLNDSCPMKLMIYGCVVRSNERGAAVAIERYEFRTQGSRSFQSMNNVGAELRLSS